MKLPEAHRFKEVAINTVQMYYSIFQYINEKKY
jgi:hypothetical protein